MDPISAIAFGHLLGWIIVYEILKEGIRGMTGRFHAKHDTWRAKKETKRGSKSKAGKPPRAERIGGHIGNAAWCGTFGTYHGLVGGAQAMRTRWRDAKERGSERAEQIHLRRAEERARREEKWGDPSRAKHIRDVASRRIERHRRRRQAKRDANKPPVATPRTLTPPEPFVATRPAAKRPDDPTSPSRAPTTPTAPTPLTKPSPTSGGTPVEEITTIPDAMRVLREELGPQATRGIEDATVMADRAKVECDSIAASQKVSAAEGEEAAVAAATAQERMAQVEHLTGFLQIQSVGPRTTAALTALNESVEAVKLAEDARQAAAEQASAAAAAMAAAAEASMAAAQNLAKAYENLDGHVQATTQTLDQYHQGLVEAHADSGGEGGDARVYQAS